MKNRTISLLSLAIMISSIYETDVLAHDQGGALGSSPYATQSWLITCFDDGNGFADSLYFDIKASTPGRKFGVTATVSKGGQKISTTDSRSGDKIRGPGAFLNAGDGEYVITLSKTKSSAKQLDSALRGAIVYGFTYHCQSGSGAHTGTLINRG